MKSKHPMMDRSTQLWPPEETPCIWMQAGLVEYKLCDHQMDCDHCSFHTMMSGHEFSTSARAKRLQKIAITKKDNMEDAYDKKDIWQAYRQIYFDPQAYYGKGFWYVKPIDDLTVEMGLDDLAILFLPTVKEIVLPRENSRLTAGQTCLWIATRSGTIPLTIPLSGKVIGVNEKILESFNHPFRVRDGLWLFKYQPDDWQKKGTTLLSGERAVNYLLHKWHTIVNEINKSLNDHQRQLGKTSLDGGEPLGSIEQMLGEEKYFAIISNFLLSE